MMPSCGQQVLYKYDYGLHVGTVTKVHGSFVTVSNVRNITTGFVYELDFTWPVAYVHILQSPTHEDILPFDEVQSSDNSYKLKPDLSNLLDWYAGKIWDGLQADE